MLVGCEEMPAYPQMYQCIQRYAASENIPVESKKNAGGTVLSVWLASEGSGGLGVGVGILRRPR